MNTNSATELPATNPDDFFGTWCVAQTQHQHEVKLLDKLMARGIGGYLPRETVRKRDAAGKNRNHDKVLFPGYVFVNTLDDQRAALWDYRTTDICKIIPVVDQVRICKELRKLHEFITSGALVERYAGSLMGKRCRVISGKFLGWEGMVLDRDGDYKLLMYLTDMGGAAAISIEPELLELAA